MHSAAELAPGLSEPVDARSSKAPHHGSLLHHTQLQGLITTARRWSSTRLGQAPSAWQTNAHSVQHPSCVQHTACAPALLSRALGRKNPMLHLKLPTPSLPRRQQAFTPAAHAAPCCSRTLGSGAGQGSPQVQLCPDSPTQYNEKLSTMHRHVLCHAPDRQQRRVLALGPPCRTAAATGVPADAERAARVRL
jgi:hypothetical protein